MERRLAVAIAVGLLACGSGDTHAPATDATSGQAPLVIDVVVDGDTASVYVREAGRVCQCNPSWPQVETCELLDDIGGCRCQPEPGVCMETLRLEREGDVAIEQSTPLEYGAYTRLTSGLFDDGQPSELVFEGCGGSARVTIPPGFPIAPEIQSLTNDGNQLHVSWTGDSSTTHSSGIVSNGHDWGICTKTAGATTTLQLFPTLLPNRNYLSLRALALTETTTELGTVRVWKVATTRIRDVVVAQPMPDGRWSLGDDWRSWSISVALNIDGSGRQGWLVPEQALLDVSGSAPLPEVSGYAANLGVEQMGYRAGVVEDELWLLTGSEPKRYSARFPHVSPTVEITTSGLSDSQFAVTIPATVLTAEDGSNETITVSAVLDWNLGRVSSPLVP